MRRTTRFSGRLAALALSCAFAVGQPTIVCGLACTILHHHEAAGSDSGMAMHDAHTSDATAMPCHGKQIGPRQAVPASLAVADSLPHHAPPLPDYRIAVSREPLSPMSPAISVTLSLDPPPPRSL
jgi:hypothetical protein